MPKWKDQRPQMPVGGLPLRKKKERPVVDISNPEPKPGDARNPVALKPPEKVELRNPEKLKIDTDPAPDGIRYDIANMGGIYDYLVVLTYGNEVFGHKPEKHNGLVPVPKLAHRTGKWTGLLIVDNETVADKIEFELDLTIQWLAEEMGPVEIRFGDTEGLMDRLGAIRVDPWPKRDRTEVPTSREDVAICILFPGLPDRLPDPAPEFTLQIERPRSGGLYYTSSAPLAEVAGYRLKILRHLPCYEPGDWTVRVLLGERVLGRTTLRVTGPAHDGIVTEGEEGVEEFAVNIVG